MQQAEERARRKAETYRRRMAALGLPLDGAPDYTPAPQQVLPYMQPETFANGLGYEQPAYPAMYPSSDLPDYLNPAPAGALQWEMPQPVVAGRRAGQVRQGGPAKQAQQASEVASYQPPGSDQAYSAEVYKEPNHGRRSHASPARRRAATAHAPLPTVKDMHLQRVATMAAAQATAQATDADVESHEQFARDLRSYRTQAPVGGGRGNSQPAWNADPASGEGLFDEAYYSGGSPGQASGELMWQTTGRPHQLQPPPAQQLKPPSKPSGRRRPGASSQAKPDSWTQPQSPNVVISAYPPQQGSPDPSPDPPDMPGINRAGLLNLRNKLRLNRPALISPPSNSYSTPLPVAAPDKPHGMSHGHGAAVNQENLAQPYQPNFPQSNSEVTPAKMAAAAATARLARRRAAAQESTAPSSDPNLSPGDVRRGVLAKQPQARSNSSQSSSSGTSSNGSEQQETAQARPKGRQLSKGRAPQKSLQSSPANPQGRALGRAPSGSSSSYSGDAQAAPSQGGAFAKSPSSNSFPGHAQGQAAAPEGRAHVRGPSGSSGFAGGLIGQPGDAPLPDAPAGDLLQCGGCGRSFNPRALEVHSRICAKIFQTKRKAFNIAEARIADTGAAQFFDARKGVPKAEAAAVSSKRLARGGLARGGSGLGTPSHAETVVGVKGKSGAKWRNQSEQLRIAMAASKGGPEAKVTAFGGAPIASAPDPSLVACPHCGRRFNEHAAERHIPKCQDIRAKPSRLMAGAGQKRQPALSPGYRGGWG